MDYADFPILFKHLTEIGGKLIDGLAKHVQKELATGELPDPYFSVIELMSTHFSFEFFGCRFVFRIEICSPEESHPVGRIAAYRLDYGDNQKEIELTAFKFDSLGNIVSGEEAVTSQQFVSKFTGTVFDEACKSGFVYRP